jgi:hypothetical protein
VEAGVDLIARGESWFEEQRRAHLSIDVEYRPRGSFVPATCRATLVVGRWDTIDKAGNIVRYETKDFFIPLEDYAADPQRGDRIVVDEGAGEEVYEVTIPEGKPQAWAWADRRQRVRRVHTNRLPAQLAGVATAVFEPGVYVPGVFA